MGNTPPKFSTWLLRFVPSHLREELDGDLLQRFERDLKLVGVSKAKWRYTRNAICCLRPGILFRPGAKTKRSSFMIRNYFTVAVRNLLSNKTRSTIAIVSLVVGIACAMIMLTIARFETSFDSFHTDASRTYRVNRWISNSDGNRMEAGLPGPAASMIKTKIASIERATAVQYYGAVQVDVESQNGLKKFKESSGTAFVDPDFFKVFDFAETTFEWISGNPETALKDPFQLVITESMAKKFFGSEPAFGKTLLLETQVECRVMGVISDFPENSDFPFTIIVSYATLYEIEGERMRDDWRSINHDNQVFVVLPHDVKPTDVEHQFDRVRANLVDKDLATEQTFRLQPLRELHRDSNLGNFRHRTMSSANIALITSIGLLLLLVGCINYINLSTAAATLRAREIGVRKVLGSGRGQLITQFTAEAFIVVAISTLVALIVAEIMLVQFSSITLITNTGHLFTDWSTWTWVGVIILAVTLLAGIYPALVISGFGIIGALHGSIRQSIGGAYARKGLVVLQFTATQAFLIAAAVVLLQLHHSRHRTLGFDQEHVITATIDPSNTSRLETLRTVLSSSAHVEQVALSSSPPAGYSRNHWFVGVRQRALSQNEEIATEYQSIDPAYAALYKIPVVAGRNFLATDSGRFVIVNETLAKALGFTSPEDAVGKVVTQDGKEKLIAGVFRDFKNNSSREKVSNMLFVLKPDFFMIANIKLRPFQDDILEVLSSLEQQWQAVFPNIVFDYKFLDQNIERMYEQERNLGTMLQLFSWVFLALSCVGLYGMLSFVITKKMKELAVRKVFGAGHWQIIGLVSREYVLLILLAFIVAAPSAYLAMEDWLESYVDRVSIEWWILVGPMVLALVVATATLAGQLLQAASRNPSEVLKSE